MLEKKYLKKGCQLVEGLSLKNLNDIVRFPDGVIEQREYRDFLQLVIEELEDLNNYSIHIYKYNNVDIRLAILDECGNRIKYRKNLSSRIEAKENAITYYFDNL